MQNIFDEFKTITSIAQLRLFNEKLDNDLVLGRALKVKIDSWLPLLGDPSETFVPERFISDDLTVAIYGQSPVVFLGTNNWAINRLHSHDLFEDRIDFYKKRVKRVMAQGQRKYCFLFVPEKDFLMDKIARNFERTQIVDAGMAGFRRFCTEAGASFVFDNFLETYPDWVSVDDYNYYDSHLLGRDYVAIVRKILAGFDLSIELPQAFFSIVSGLGYGYGDFKNRLLDGRKSDPKYMLPQINKHDAILTAGNTDLESPLSKNYQFFKNDNYIIDAKIAIFGDSHSSISAQRRLTYLFSSIFRVCEFNWKPWGGPEFKTDADYVLMEMSQRFMYGARNNS